MIKKSMCGDGGTSMMSGSVSGGNYETVCRVGGNHNVKPVCGVGVVEKAVRGTDGKYNVKTMAGTGGIEMSVDTDGLVQSLTDIQTDTHWEKPAAVKPTGISSKHFKNIDLNFSGKKSGRKSSK